jgi:hypothetical protein
MKGGEHSERFYWLDQSRGLENVVVSERGKMTAMGKPFLRCVARRLGSSFAFDTVLLDSRIEKRGRGRGV